jgi:hypothetical protein
MQDELLALSTEEDPTGDCDVVSFFLGDLESRRDDDRQQQWTADEAIIELDCNSLLDFVWADESPPPPSDAENLLDAMASKLRPLQDVLRTRLPKTRKKTDT